jgi:hypothetical protein
MALKTPLGAISFFYENSPIYSNVKSLVSTTPEINETDFETGGPGGTDS